MAISTKEDATCNDNESKREEEEERLTPLLRGKGVLGDDEVVTIVATAPTPDRDIQE